MTSAPRRINKVRIGDCIELVKIKCGIPNLTVNDVSGINRDKEFFEPSKQVGSDTSDYKIVPPGCFACNLMHIGRDVVLPISINQTLKNKIVSGAYHVFKFIDESKLLKEYFFIFLKSSEKDRYFWFHCDSSVRDGMDWDVFCDIEIEVPSIDVQRKYVAIYESLLSNLHSYQNNLDDFKTACDLSIESFKRRFPMKPLNTFASLIDERNKENKFRNVYGLTVYKKFIETKADLRNVLLTNYKIVRKGDIAFVPTTNRNGDKIACGLCEEDCIVSQIYKVMRLDTTKVVPGYVFMWFLRTEMDRFARYNSWGSARENISWEDLGSYQIPIPPIETQISIMKLNEIFCRRKKYIDELKVVINKICPILIRGSIIEAEGGKQNAN